MRRTLFALAMFGLVTAAPLSARGDDAEITRQIIAKLKEEKAAGHLQGFDIDLKVEGGVVWLKGRVATAEQEQMVLETARLTPGVTKVLKKIQVGDEAIANTEAPSSRAPQAMQPAQVSSPSSSSPTSSRRNATEESTLQLLTGPAIPQPISLAPSSDIISPARVLSATPTATVSDEEIGQQIIAQLNQQDAAGRFEGCDVNLKVDGGVVWFKGTVASPEQEQLAVQIAYATPGVTKVMKNIQVTGLAAQPAPESVLKLATATQPAPGQTANAGLQKVGPAQPQLAPVSPYYAHPYAGYHPAANQTPVAFAPARPASAELADAAGAATGATAGPPAHMAGYGPAAPIHPVGAYGAAGVRYDHPHLPAYAWPTYAAYPNYAAVTYPKQYSPTVWPYIGPFYPYPQVPLGWRKVVLEWDDGWWQLDFKDQSRPWKMR